MTLVDAMKVFGIVDISTMTEDDIKKLYRRLMRRNHPDIGGSDEKAKEINTANELLNSAIQHIVEARKLEELKNTSKSIPCAVKFSDYISLFSGSTMTVPYNGVNYELSSKTLSKFNVYVDVEAELTCNGDKQSIKKRFLRRIDDKYQIDCIAHVNSLSETMNLTVSAYGKSRDISVSSSSIELSLRYDYNVTLVFRIERRLVDNGNH